MFLFYFIIPKIICQLIYYNFFLFFSAFAGFVVYNFLLQTLKKNHFWLPQFFSTLKTESLLQKSLLFHYYKRWDGKMPSHLLSWFYSLQLANTIWQRTVRLKKQSVYAWKKHSILHNTFQVKINANTIYCVGILTIHNIS